MNTMENDSTQNVVGYFPVFHAGYLELLEYYPEADIGVLGSDVLSARFDYLRKDIRALRPEQAVDIINGINRRARLIGERSLLAALNSPNLIMPDDEVSRKLAEEFSLRPQLEPVFLRWDRRNTNINQEVIPDRTISLDSDDPVIKLLNERAAESTNWWRRLGAVISIDGEVAVSSHNSSVPTAYSSAIDGDPRITVNRGVAIETSIDMHAEARAISLLAKRGVSTSGADIFVNTFPCPNCAKLIVESGISSCYFVEGYATIDGQSVLTTGNVEIIKVITDTPPETPRSYKPYPKS